MGAKKKRKLYVLELEDECYYVGMAYDIKHRFESHMSGNGGSLGIWIKRWVGRYPKENSRVC